MYSYFVVLKDLFDLCGLPCKQTEKCITLKKKAMVVLLIIMKIFMCVTNKINAHDNVISFRHTLPHL